MKLILQQVNFATINIKEKNSTINETRKIWKGVIIYLGVWKNDNSTNNQEPNYQLRIDKFFDKLTKLKCRDNGDGNLSATLSDTWGGILIVSNFTLYANYKSWNKINFSDSAKFDEANTIYNYFVEQAKRIFPDKIQTGKFWANMNIISEVSWPVNYVFEI